MGKILVPRLPAYPSYVGQPERWFAPKVATRVRQMADSEGWARDDEWAPGRYRGATAQAPRCWTALIR